MPPKPRKGLKIEEFEPDEDILQMVTLEEKIRGSNGLL